MKNGSFKFKELAYIITIEKLLIKKQDPRTNISGCGAGVSWGGNELKESMQVGQFFQMFMNVGITTRELKSPQMMKGML